MTAFKNSVLLLSFLLLCFIPVNAKNLCWTSIRNSSGAKVYLRTEVVSTPKTRSRGLMFRRQLPKNNGMLFVFSKDLYLHFWMKNTYIPLSIAYMDSSGFINEIYQMKPHDTTAVLSRSKARYALEVNRGWFAKNKIKAGARVILSGCISQ